MAPTQAIKEPALPAAPAPDRTTAWPAAKVEMRAIEQLIPYARNPNMHSPEQVDQIAASIKEFGWTVPVLVDESGVILAGHGRVMAGLKLGIRSVPVIIAVGWSDAQKRAYVIADNQLPRNSEWNVQLLRAEIGDLKALDFDLDLLGFNDLQMVEFSTGFGGAGKDPEQVPEPPANPVSKEGDLWVLGRHRLLCGDSTKAADVTRLLGGVKPHLMVTDPPYGTNYDPTWRHRAGVNKSTRVGKVNNDDRADWAAAWALFPGHIAYVWHGALHASTVAESLTKQGFTIRSQIIWAKDRLVIGRGDYHWQHEPCWYAVRKTGNWTGDRNQTTLWSIPTGGQDTETAHGTQKPIECMKRPIENNSSPGQSIYEPFSGSGTTIIAAEMSGRAAFAMEVAPAYVDIAVRRWEAYAGGKAKLDGADKGFAEVAAERGVAIAA